MDSLKPCMCGGEATIIMHPPFEMKIKCTVCGTTYTARVRRYTLDDIKDRVIEHWNNRPLEDALQSERDGLKEQVEHWIGEKDRYIDLYSDAKAERDALRQQLDVAIKALEYVAIPMTEPVTMRETMAKVRAQNALAKIAKLGEKK